MAIIFSEKFERVEVEDVLDRLASSLLRNNQITGSRRHHSVQKEGYPLPVPAPHDLDVAVKERPPCAFSHLCSLEID